MRVEAPSTPTPTPTPKPMPKPAPTQTQILVRMALLVSPASSHLHAGLRIRASLRIRMRMETRVSPASSHLHAGRSRRVQGLARRRRRLAEPSLRPPTSRTGKVSGGNGGDVNHRVSHRGRGCNAWDLPRGVDCCDGAQGGGKGGGAGRLGCQFAHQFAWTSTGD